MHWKRPNVETFGPRRRPHAWRFGRRDVWTTFSPAHRRTRGGFTLIETIAAIVILAIAIPPMIWAVREAHAQRVGPAQVATARWLAAEKLEDVIADRHSTTRGYSFLVPGNYPAESPVSGFPGFSRTVSILVRGPDLVSAGSGYKVVTANVQWTDGGGVQRTMALTTVLTELEP